MSYNLGVDLGTTFVGAAVAQANQVEMFTLGDRSVVAPAVVYRRDDGELVAGESANRRAVSSPGRVSREFKRRLGDPTPVLLGGGSYSVTELLGVLLGEVLRRVTETEGGRPDKVVLTHPANWGPFRRGLFEEVSVHAGLTDIDLITEPEAAAAHYASTRQLSDGEIVAVYDLGGGTFDATVLRSRSDGVEILGIPEGIERLGGVDFDEAIFSHVNHFGGGALDELDKRDPQTVIALARLRQDCVLAKEALSRDTDTTIPVFLPGKHFEVKLSRAEFEDMIRAPIESSISALVRALRSAEVSPGDLSGVLLVGGSSRIPLVGRMVSEELGKPTVVDTHPKYAVALGAATVARARSGQRSLTRPAPAGAGQNALDSRVSTASDSPTDQPAPGATGIGPADGQRRPPTPAGEPAPTPGPGGDRGTRRRPLLLAAILVVLIGVVAAFLLIRPFGGSTSASGEQASAALAPPATGAPVAAVATPGVGTPVAVGATPGFAAVSPNGRLLYVAGGDAKTVTVLDTAANRVIATVPIPAGPPQFLTFAPDGRRVYVSIFDESGSISLVAALDTTTNAIIGQVPVPGRPFRAAVSADGKILYVPRQSASSISEIDTGSFTVIRTIPVGPDPHWVELSRDGTRAFSASHGSNLIDVIDLATSTVVAHIPVGTSPHALALHPTQPLLAAVNFDSNSVSVINTTTNTVAATVRVGKNPQAVAWSPDGRFAYTVNDGDNTVSVISAATGQVTATIPTGRTPTSIAALPDGKRAYVTNLSDNTVTLLNPAG